jgi:hypothetical protein
MQQQNRLHVKQITPSPDYCGVAERGWINILTESLSGSEKQWFSRRGWLMLWFSRAKERT